MRLLVLEEELGEVLIEDFRLFFRILGVGGWMVERSFFFFRVGVFLLFVLVNLV